jgi:hypothetical protein
MEVLVLLLSKVLMLILKEQFRANYLEALVEIVLGLVLEEMVQEVVVMEVEE